MTYKDRQLATTLRVMSALAACFLAFSGAALADHKPNHNPGGGGGPGGGDTGGGIIYFRHAGVLQTMNSDGSNKTPLPAGVDGEPSRDLHGSHRWFLQLRDIPAEFYPVFVVQPQFSGQGTNDLQIVSFLGDPVVDAWTIAYRIEIDSEGSPDTFTWSANPSYGPSFEVTGVPITGGEQQLDLYNDGSAVLTVEFGSTTGHTLGDSWLAMRAEKAQRRELFVVRDDGDETFTVQLTTQPDLEPVFSVRWGPDATFDPPLDDGLVSWTARRWDLGTGEVLEGGIYTAAITFDSGGNVVGLAQQPVVPSVALALVETGGSTLTPDIEYHDWSPDGTAIVYNEIWVGWGRLIVFDLLTGLPSELTTTLGRDPNWSPSGTKIAFKTMAQKAIKSVSPDGTNEKTIAKLPPKGFSLAILVEPRWSPTGSHMIYGRLDPGSPDKTAIYRVTAGGQGKTDLTDDIEGFPVPVGWR